MSVGWNEEWPREGGTVRVMRVAVLIAVDQRAFFSNFSMNWTSARAPSMGKAL